jgi:hypothetical protein
MSLRLTELPDGTFTISGLSNKAVADICAVYTQCLVGPNVDVFFDAIEHALSNPEILAVLRTKIRLESGLDPQLFELCALVRAHKTLSNAHVIVKPDVETGFSPPSQET